MATLPVAERQHRRQRRLAAKAVVAARSAWRLLDQTALDATSHRLLARLVPLLTMLQLAAATRGAEYVDQALRAQGIDAEPVGEVEPRRLAGIASDGRPLASLILQPLIAVKALIGAGVPVVEAMAAGRFRLERIAATQVADAGRVATGLGVVARPGIGYVRMLQPPSCSRCVILAGRIYRWNAGFLRHPLCDCIHVPTTETAGRNLTTDPRAYFDSLTKEQQDRIFTKAGAQAIRDGANIAQVVNARRGMRTAQVFGRDVLITLEGTTRRGLAGRRLIAEGARLRGDPAEVVRRLSRTGTVQRQVIRQRAQIPRLMPEQIYRDATSREDAIRLLRRFGYITN